MLIQMVKTIAGMRHRSLEMSVMKLHIVDTMEDHIFERFPVELGSVDFVRRKGIVDFVRRKGIVDFAMIHLHSLDY